MAKGKVTFNEDICKGCELCVSVCPKKIISLNKNVINKKGYNPAYVTDQDECIACGNCAIMCPDSVIKVERL
ncbi:2-oxoglutarate ferredoxin oxidoreductase subunit delta [Sedimentibacter acidaminivorans]|uniref:2-oxoglutarate ferredoxin oxidoreductase subunit delta n=1 Tax=Sedimentibacter acidaminivorans TaxID=913099 RepID=A0ABS4GDH0_9FIRM|nr:4Fe-4S binding protein [Sedimentibacter acidaminivorans]MBP1925557.1 2-oxoglutarate ferredoxin oxidoreductase subunit delta [Sedimentibacter acidaminivorans]